jgi:F0F1-type ATP synthase membrane subunit a
MLRPLPPSRAKIVVKVAATLTGAISGYLLVQSAWFGLEMIRDKSTIPDRLVELAFGVIVEAVVLITSIQVWRNSIVAMSFICFYYVCAGILCTAYWLINLAADRRFAADELTACVIGTLALAAFVFIGIQTESLARQQQKLRERFCYACGYDLTGNVSGICPECGEKIETEADRR